MTQIFKNGVSIYSVIYGTSVYVGMYCEILLVITVQERPTPHRLFVWSYNKSTDTNVGTVVHAATFKRITTQ